MSAATLKQGWASVVIQRHWRGYHMRQIYQVVRLASITIQAFTRGWMARKRYKKVCYIGSIIFLTCLIYYFIT